MKLKHVCEIINIFVLLDKFFCLILNENTLSLNFLSHFFYLVAFIWEFEVLKVNSKFACWIFAYLRVIASKNQRNGGHGQKIDFAQTLSV